MHFDVSYDVNECDLSLKIFEFRRSHDSVYDIALGDAWKSVKYRLLSETL